MVAHNFKCEYVDLGASISLCHNIHSENKVFPCIKNQRCFFARCVYMPIGAIRLKGHIARPFFDYKVFHNSKFNFYIIS
ncbi:unknown [Bacteroides sp. CAG:1060]|nr:unknown [Bacteroides sp. CAG:1060]